MASVKESAGEASEKDPAETFSMTPLYRQAISFFEKFDRYELQEMLCWSGTNWMLSIEDYKIPTEPPCGLVSQMPTLSESQMFILIPVEPGVENIDYKELHTILRELTVGIYACNQLPGIALEGNFDQSTSCQLPPAYIDTKVGQLLVHVDYMMKSLWHGSTFHKEKRVKFAERWRATLDVNQHGKPDTKKPLLQEFLSAGLMDITRDEHYGKIYDTLPTEPPGDAELAEERKFFMSKVDTLSLQMTLFQKSVKRWNNFFLADSDWLISSIVRLPEDQLDLLGYERLNSRLQVQQNIVQAHLGDKPEVKRKLALLKIVAFLTPFLVALRKRMRIPDISKLLSPLIGEEIRTERELPPLMLSTDFKCKNFSFGNSNYFHLHGGIQIDTDTPNVTEFADELKEGIQREIRGALAVAYKLLDPSGPIQESYPAQMITVQDQRYFVLPLETESYYPQPPQNPLWVRAIAEETSKLRNKRLPITDNNLFEQFKKYFGIKRAIKNKALPVGLRTTCQRGLPAMFNTLTRKCPPAQLSKQDEQGFSLAHHAAMFNRPHMIGALILQAVDINVRRYGTSLSQDELVSRVGGPTPLHLAARCGGLDSVHCLVANFANVLVADSLGWTPIHHAAYFDHEPTIRLLLRRQKELIELPTKNNLRSSPLLLAASSGALSAVRCLIELGAKVTKKDEAANGIVHLAALRFHTNILEFLIKWDNPNVPVWKILVEMLKDKEEQRADSCVKCLEVICVSSPDHWKCILGAGGIPALVNLLKSPSDAIKAVSASTLCKISENNDVREALSASGAGPILIGLLSSPVNVIQSRASLVLSDLACVSDNQDTIAGLGGIPPLVHLLDSHLEDVLVNAVNAIRVLCTGSKENQNLVAAEGNAVKHFVEFLSANSDVLQAASSAAIAAIVRGNRSIQDQVVNQGALGPLVDLIRGRTNMTVQVKAASAVEALSENNLDSQRAFLELEAEMALLKLLKISPLKFWAVEVKEQGALALWALAGDMLPQQKYIASTIGIQLLIEVVMTKSEKLQYTGCLALISLARENVENQNQIGKDGGIQPLVRLLRSGGLVGTSQRVLMATIKTLGTLCLGVAHRNNPITQKKIADEDAISLLISILLDPPSDEVKVQVAATLGCLVMGNKENQMRLKEISEFSYNLLLDMVHSENKVIRLGSCTALANFAFNNTVQQFAIREAGGIEFAVFDDFLTKGTEYERCHAAFQIVVLARDVIGMDQVTLTAVGVTTLVEHMHSQSDNIVILCAGFLASLAHTRAGIPDAIVTSGAVDLLTAHLAAENEQVRQACAVALGYLTFNRCAARMLLKACRETPQLYSRLTENIRAVPDARIASDFIESFDRAQIVGLPCMFLEVNGGPPAVPPPSRLDGSRSYTRMTNRRHTAGPRSRVVSAPAYVRSRAFYSPTREPKGDVQMSRMAIPSGKRHAPSRNSAKLVADGTLSRAKTATPGLMKGTK